MAQTHSSIESPFQVLNTKDLIDGASSESKAKAYFEDGLVDSVNLHKALLQTQKELRMPLLTARVERITMLGEESAQSYSGAEATCFRKSAKFAVKISAKRSQKAITVCANQIDVATGVGKAHDIFARSKGGSMVYKYITEDLYTAWTKSGSMSGFQSIGDAKVSPPALVIHDKQAFSRGLQVANASSSGGPAPVVIVYGSGGGSVLAVRQNLFGIDSVTKFPESVQGLLNGTYTPNAFVIWVSRDPDMSDAVPAPTTIQSLQALGQPSYIPPPGTSGYKNFLGEIVYNMILTNVGVDSAGNKVANFSEYNHTVHALVPGGKERTIVFDQFVEAVGAGNQKSELYPAEFGHAVALTTDFPDSQMVPYAAGFNNTGTSFRIFGAAAVSEGLWKTTSAQRGSKDSFISKLQGFMSEHEVPAAASFLGAVPSLLATLRLFATHVLKREDAQFAKEVNIRFDLEIVTKQFLVGRAGVGQQQAEVFLKQLRLFNNVKKMENGFYKYPSGASCEILHNMTFDLAKVCVKSGTATTLVLTSEGPCSTNCSF